MSNKLEITIDVIVHATEDMTKIFQPFNEIFDIEEEIFNKTETTGYFVHRRLGQYRKSLSEYPRSNSPLGRSQSG